ncbi:DoxX family protein [Hymenobacter sp. 5516J-16]|uniref:DoxX family protein n=1 Tax=Hymenobacter sp. 5516J-16 TaxID=2932253 RepID=UPI001FD12EEA|nr:DoxX family protein [Hymenobacter sp. 5516J-16]UOQ77921.1 DoxX family protein [Hymenobacter sp. 5516J-16]
MKPLFVLLIVFGLLVAGTYFFRGEADYRLAGNGAMAAMLLFTGAAHFAFTQGMMQMLPAFLPAKKAWVYATGVLELAAAVGLLFPSLRGITAGCLLIFFLLILPANILAARRNLNYQTGTLDGSGPRYLWFRVPLQLFFMAWTWYFGLHLAAETAF